MAPDINTLPTSRPPSIPGSPLARHQRPRRISLAGTDTSLTNPPSPRSPTLSSLQAAATINAGLHHRSPTSASPARNPGLERRRSSLMNNFALNDPAVPAPGELQQSTASPGAGSPRSARRSFITTTADPRHARQPSLGQLHQELEQENEAQVNRLLYMIRLQQEQLATLQAQNGNQAQPTPDTTPPVDQASPRASPIPTPSHLHSASRPRTLSRRSSSRVPSFASSPSPSSAIGPHTEDFLLSGSRDESAFYQAETQTLTRENQMLKARIRELERQVADMGAPRASNSSALGGTGPTASTVLTGDGSGDAGAKPA